ncbi:MAG: SIS domain-containing protein [Labrys sp. (in: a-proteobacteria)]|jgi:D-sedoheptulose 7-phosphate isomerase
MSDLSAYLRLSARVIEETASLPSMARVPDAIAAIVAALAVGKPLLVCGNGGSAADAMHITGELVGRFLKQRRALNCICLATNASVITAWSNDEDFSTVFARQVEAYGVAGGVVLGLSTSGNSANVIEAIEAGRAAGMTTIAMTGRGGGRLAAIADITIDVASEATPLIQQAHICLYHHICEEVEARLADRPA